MTKSALERFDFKLSDKNSICLDRLKKLIDTTTREEIAKSLNCDTSLITKHYNGDRNITLDYAVKYAKYFDVSLDYLAGITDTPATDKDIRFICDYTGLSQRAVENLNDVHNLPVLIVDSLYHTINFFLEHEQLSPFSEIRAYKEAAELALKVEKESQKYASYREAKEAGNPLAMFESDQFIDQADTIRYRAVRALEHNIDEFVPEYKEAEALNRKKWEEREKEWEAEEHDVND